MNSVWLDTAINNKEYSKLENNINADVCIIGAGITGITTAYLNTNEEAIQTVKKIIDSEQIECDFEWSG